MTVSRTINGDPRVSDVTAEAVRAAIAALGYVPRPASDGRRSASRARRGLHTGRIALLFPDTSLAALRTALSARLIDGIDRRLSAQRLQLLVTRLPAVDQLPDCIDLRHIDGVIVRYRKPWQAERLRGIPSVQMLECDGPPRCDAVMPDSRLIAILAAERLAMRGCRRILLVDDMPYNPAHQVRHAAFVEHAQQLGMTIEYLAVVMSEPDTVRKTIAGMLRGRKPVDGVFLPGTGQVVALVAQLIREQTPERDQPVARIVACCHDRDFLALLPFAIDNIDIGAEAIGMAAVDLLAERIATPTAPFRTVLIAPVISTP